MKKQYRVGVVLAGVMGLALFGSTTPATAKTPVEPGASLEAAAHPAAVGDQTLANLGAKPTGPLTQARTQTLACAAGMVEVEGDYCPSVEEKCLRWLDPETKSRCAEFEESSTCIGHPIHKHFCIDQYEYPNVAGEKPEIMKDWYQAKATCQSEGKRLCGDSEWTLACEGQERLPYPYGYARNADACNIDKPHLDVDEAAIADPARRDAEVARLDQRSASGAHPACVSPFGAYDMTGNVDEWVVNESGKPFKSGLKGGYWGPVRDRCRPMTIAHDELFEFYQIGFRCCAEPSGPAGSAVQQGLARAPGSGGSQGTMLAGS